ncbi:hypothetical protein DFQ26_002449 [Actinomortierella ambigua]|nr:hypothetical protein DFQ26_002449 [Actinomortierella ambigua]
MDDENQSPSSLETVETIENHDTPSPTSTISNNTPHVDHLPRPPPPVMTLSLGSLSNFQPQRQQPIFNPADTPPPYSPTHTILPHYFSLVPIPIRSYTIKESSTLPSLLDFWLHTTSSHNNNSSSSTRPSSPAQERLQLQERGQPRQTGGPELKYSLIRPTQSDRTAIPPGHPSFTQDTFIPPWALVKADFPARWIWWGTEALHLVVFGRQLKNVYMEWRWRRSRSRIGGPVITRLIGCSFRITPERGYCWRQGTGRATNLTMTTPPPSRQRSRLHRSSTETRATRSAHTVIEMGNEGGGGGGSSTHWNSGRAANLQDDDLSASRSSRGSGSFFSRLFPSRSRSSTVSAAAAAATTAVAPSISTSPSPSPQATPPPTITVSPSSPTSVELQRLPSVSSPSHPLEDSTVYTTGEPPGGDILGPADRVSILHRLDSRGSVVALSDIAEEDLGRNLPPASHNAGDADGDGHQDSHSHIYNHSHNNDVHYEEEDDDDDNDTDDDDEVGVYHCREESIEGVPGRLVAVYRPARAANRAQDLAARSCKLEIYAEIGERCETALMFMCSRLDDLFMAIPESKPTTTKTAAAAAAATAAERSNLT